ncbi:rhodanese-like domain-containing protein [Pseudozobellia sp. WGM2]|uniref:rhodanese-like domain-containing protein n=1 Tax=Pseudozobellia sp. WGM2 TaxID=2787625 RepID=UPI001AE06BBC|nr:rhodanese-like domain-containing protein [Pseudozobellia sp. WGM2]
MRFKISVLLVFLLADSLLAQNKMDKAIKKWNKASVPYIQVEELEKSDDVWLLDTRKVEEFSVSHIKNALWVGHKEFEIDSINEHIKDKDKKIVVYCSIGVRSEDIGEKLLQAGYSNVQNLYGGIFEWKNKGYTVYDIEGNETEKIHAFNKHWGKLLKNGDKVFD